MTDDPMTQSNTPPVKILFVCVGNACRSQMGEAWANHFGNGRVEAHSAGTYPFGSIVDDTSSVMSEKGISLEGQWSKGLPSVAVEEMDVVVSMGREVEFPLPAGLKGAWCSGISLTLTRRSMETFRNVRDMIERQVLKLLPTCLVARLMM